MAPPEWLVGCEFTSSGGQLWSCPRASRKMIKDVIRSAFKDESRAFVSHSWLLHFHFILVIQAALKVSLRFVDADVELHAHMGSLLWICYRLPGRNVDCVSLRDRGERWRDAKIWSPWKHSYIPPFSFLKEGICDETRITMRDKNVLFCFQSSKCKEDMWTLLGGPSLLFFYCFKCLVDLNCCLRSFINVYQST